MEVGQAEMLGKKRAKSVMQSVSASLFRPYRCHCCRKNIQDTAKLISFESGEKNTNFGKKQMDYQSLPGEPEQAEQEEAVVDESPDPEDPFKKPASQCWKEITDMLNELASPARISSTQKARLQRRVPWGPDFLLAMETVYGCHGEFGLVSSRLSKKLREMLDRNGDGEIAQVEFNSFHASFVSAMKKGIRGLPEFVRYIDSRKYIQQDAETIMARIKEDMKETDRPDLFGEKHVQWSPEFLTAFEDVFNLAGEFGCIDEPRSKALLQLLDKDCNVNITLTEFRNFLNAFRKSHKETMLEYLQSVLPPCSVGSQGTPGTQRERVKLGRRLKVVLCLGGILLLTTLCSTLLVLKNQSRILNDEHALRDEMSEAQMGAENNGTNSGTTAPVEVSKPRPVPPVTPKSEIIDFPPIPATPPATPPETPPATPPAPPRPAGALTTPAIFGPSFEPLSFYCVTDRGAACSMQLSKSGGLIFRGHTASGSSMVRANFRNGIPDKLDAIRIALEGGKQITSVNLNLHTYTQTLTYSASFQPRLDGGKVFVCKDFQTMREGPVDKTAVTSVSFQLPEYSSSGAVLLTVFQLY
eukprot:g73128.t1